MSVLSRCYLAAAAFLGACALLISSAADVRAQAGSGSFIIKFRDWEVHKAQVGGARVCYAAAIPKKSRGKYKRRGETSLLVSFWPSHKIHGQVEIRAGYTYRTGSVATLRFNNGATFKLRTDADSAWGDNADADRKIVRNLSDRSRLTVTGKSSRGTRTVDTFSLNGFRAAFARAKSACGM